MTSDDRWTDMTTFDEELDALLTGATPAPEAPAWCSDVAVLVRTLQAPARPGELAGEADIVARMRELLTLPIDDGDDGAGDAGEPGIAAVDPADPDDPTDADDEDGEAGEAGEIHRLGAYAATGDDVVDLRTAERLRSRMDVFDLNGYRAKHGDRSYIAKHAAARLEASRYPVARTVGRVVAMKAAAVTTAAVIGVAAAAAATTGIVATVVVPAINDHVRRPPAVSVPADKDDTGTSSDEGRSGDGRDGDDSPAVSVPAEPGAPAPATGSSTATTASTTTSTTTSTTSTTSTTEPETPPTSDPPPTTEPPPTTVPEPTTFEGGG